MAQVAGAPKVTVLQQAFNGLHLFSIEGQPRPDSHCALFEAPSLVADLPNPPISVSEPIANRKKHELHPKRVVDVTV